MQTADGKIQLLHGDCLILMHDIPDRSIDMILCDLPYGVLNKNNVNAKWDAVIPFDALWKQYTRIIKDNGAIVLFGSGMFTAKLMVSQSKLWRYNLIWDKIQKTGFLNANRMPLRQHEDICVFYKKMPVYHPQMIKCESRRKNHNKKDGNLQETNNCYGQFHKSFEDIITDKKFPGSIIQISRHQGAGGVHPTEKPVEICEWLIKTYTNEDDLVLDNCCGSGSTGVACLNTGRRFIGMELDDNFFTIAQKRLGLEVRG